MSGRPGRRFIRYHAQVQSSASYLSIAVGIAVVVVGLLLSLTPGPGLVVALLGAAILAGQSRTVARALDHAEIRGRKAVRNLDRLIDGRKRSPPRVPRPRR